MSTISISTMTADNIAVKEPFTRAIPSSASLTEASGGPINYEVVTQDDFLREFDPNSHRIKSLIYYPNLLASPEGGSKYQAKIRSRVAIAWQRRIHTKRLIALTGYDPDITSSRSKSDDESQKHLAMFKEGWSVKGMDTAIHLAIKSDLKVGDTAICGYKSKGTGFGYRIFAYDKGDILYPHFDPITGELAIFGREFKRKIYNDKGISESVRFLDVWDEENYMQYREAASWEPNAGKFIVSINPTPHAFPFCPVAYHRYGEPCWAGSQSVIEQNELSMSQLSENNAQYALRILYTLGSDFEMEGSSDGTPRLINGLDPNSKVGFLEPADASSSFDLELKKQEQEIMRCSFAVESPELKSGSDVSSLTIKMLMADSYIKALEDSREYEGFLRQVVSIFIEGYGTETLLLNAFKSLNIVAKLQPWVFQSETEVVNTVVQLVSVGVLSKRSATEYIYETLGLGSLDEAERLLEQENKELAIEGGSLNNNSKE